MTTVSDLIAAVNQRRLLKTGKSAEEGSGYPQGWQRWLDALTPADGVPPHPDSRDWIKALKTKPLEQPPSLRGLARPFFQLLRLSRPFDPRDERSLRIGATSADIALHLILAALLLWLMYLQMYPVAVPEDDSGGSDDAVQVEFIGRGNAQEGGGALATAGAQAAPASASAAPSGRPSPSPAAPAASAGGGSPEPVREAVPTPAVTPPAASQAPTLTQAAPVEETVTAQPLQVSVVPKPEPQARFQLPPPRELSVQAPQPRVPQLQAQVEALTTLRASPIRTLEVRPAQPQLRQQELRETVRAIEVFTPNANQLARERALPSTATGQSQLRVPTLAGQVQELPSGGAGAGGRSTATAGSGAAALGAGAQGAGGTAAQPGGTGQAQAGTGHGAAPGSQGGRGANATGAGAGPGVRAAAGGWPGAGRSDDWGASNRNAPGTGSGRGGRGDGGRGDGGRGDGRGSDLFGDDGRARLPDQWSANSGVDIDRQGTWLKRPGLEYRGTRFDQYWIPSGTLLQEWVRRGVKELSIPIPGTSMSLKCVVSLLQLGGGCLPHNPDVNEQSATGRPAPVIPFKPELQEDNGSVRPPPVPQLTPPKPATPTPAGSGG